MLPSSADIRQYCATLLSASLDKENVVHSLGKSASPLVFLTMHVGASVSLVKSELRPGEDGLYCTCIKGGSSPFSVCGVAVDEMPAAPRPSKRTAEDHPGFCSTGGQMRRTSNGGSNWFLFSQKRRRRKKHWLVPAPRLIHFIIVCSSLMFARFVISRHASCNKVPSAGQLLWVDPSAWQMACNEAQRDRKSVV